MVALILVVMSRHNSSPISFYCEIVSMNWAGITELGVGELVHGDNFSLFEAMSALEVSSPQLIMFVNFSCSVYVILIVDLLAPLRCTVTRGMWGCYHSIFVCLMTFESVICALILGLCTNISSAGFRLWTQRWMQGWL